MNTRRTAIKRAAATAIIVGAVSLAGIGTASAGHGHSKQVGNGGCVLLAQHGGEADVVLPFATDAQVKADRAHPLHLRVHLGRPGENFGIWVAGSETDPCVDYVNG